MSEPENEKLYTIEEYLALEEKAEYKSEYYQGRIVPVFREAKSNGTIDGDVHFLICANMVRELGNALKERDCFVFGSGLQVKSEELEKGLYPDAMVVCGPCVYFQDARDTIGNPTLIVEVLSDSTTAWDWSGKFRQYQLLDTFQEYVLVDQSEPQIEIFRRAAGGLWVLEGYKGLEAVVEFKSIGVSIPTREIYHLIEFE